MFEGVSEIAGRIAELQTALDSYGSQSSSANASDGASFQQTLEQAQSAGGSGSSSSATPSSTGSLADSLPGGASAAASGAPLRPTAFSPSQLGAKAMSIGTGGATQLPSGAAALGALGLGGANSPDLASLMGGGSNADPSGLAGLMGGSSGADTTGLAGLMSGSGLGMLGGMGQGLGGLLGSSGEAYGAQSNTMQDALSAGGLGSQDPSGLQGIVGQIAQNAGVNPALAQAVAKAESGYNPQAVSPAGAQGLMQLMPSTFNAYTSRAGGLPSGAPVQGATISQAFGPTTFASEPALDWNGANYSHFHTGVDLAVGQGTPIRATAGGKVEIRSDPGGFGNLVVVRNGPWDVLYGHTSGHPASIQTGSVVKPGDVIGYVGSTGNSTGPHVHYEIRYNGQIIDPSPFLQPGAAAAAASPAANPMDPVANAKAGVGYLKDMLTRFKNNVPDALAAYNAGPNAVDQYGGVPPYPETQNYVQKTMQYAHDLGA